MLEDEGDREGVRSGVRDAEGVIDGVGEGDHPSRLRHPRRPGPSGPLYTQRGGVSYRSVVRETGGGGGPSSP